ncbi:MAG: ribosome silencing factor [Saprospiraceae bacterium]|nr:ribosome silencing factor [Saprospiraceae bacterium]
MEVTKVLKTDIEETVLADLIVDAIRDIKGDNIVKIDLRKVADAPAPFFIICEAESSVKINAITNNIYRRVFEELGLKPGHMEGGSAAKWNLIDYLSIIVHIFNPEARVFYDLEGLWSDGDFTTFDSV